MKYYETSYITRQEEKDDKRTEQEMIDGVRERLLEAIRLRMRADVKIGVYLSGGLDSSTLLGMATTLTNKSIDTYSIAFKDHAYFDEQSLCIGTNKFLGENRTTPHILETTHDQLAEHFEDCVYHSEYPLMHISGVGKYILSKLVQDNNGKVVLTGEGSDEIFSGYVTSIENLTDFY
jgi:asparagine synthase (glutamine-hydrolysing)